MIPIRTLLAVAAALLLPEVAVAYLNPEDVLLNRELFTPPTARESQMRSEIQMEETAARREREQEAAFTLQHPVVEEAPVVHTAAPAQQMQNVIFAVPIQGAEFTNAQTLFGATAGNPANLDTANLELLRTMRLLSRVNANQSIMQHASATGGAHGGAPLSGTGPGGILTAMTMVGAIGWTMRRAAKAAKAAIAS